MRDDDRISGAYRGAQYNSCNLLKRRHRKIPVFLHKCGGYDSHLIVSALGNHKDRELKVIAQTMENHLKLKPSNHIVYKDTLRDPQLVTRRTSTELAIVRSAERRPHAQ